MAFVIPFTLNLNSRLFDLKRQPSENSSNKSDQLDVTEGSVLSPIIILIHINDN